jgi:anti-sigma B factor antagonist
VHRSWEKGEQAMRIEVMQPTGNLNATSTNHFRQQANSVLDRKPDVLLIDLKHLKQMDSSGLGALIFVLRSAKAIGCKFALCSISEYIDFLLEVTSMKALFDVFENRSQFEHSLDLLGNKSTAQSRF